MRDRPNLTIMTEPRWRHRFEKQDDGLATTGVQLIHKGERRQVVAKAEVILAAGAIASPQLLQLSGIGEANALQTHDIPVHHTLPGVGQNLQDHLQIRTIYQVDNTVTLNQRAHALGHGHDGTEYFSKKQVRSPCRHLS